jgi:hypothetical protein
MIGNMALKKIIGLCNHETKSMRLVALHCLWNLSAYEENKGNIILFKNNARAITYSRLARSSFDF